MSEGAKRKGRGIRKKLETGAQASPSVASADSTHEVAAEPATSTITTLELLDFIYGDADEDDDRPY